MKFQFCALFICSTLSLSADYYDYQYSNRPSSEYYSDPYPYTNTRDSRYNSYSNYSQNQNNPDQYGYRGSRYKYSNLNDAYPYNNYRDSAYSGYASRNGYSSFSNSRGYADENTPAQNTMFKRQEHLGDWDYKENWRYDRDAYLRGETEPKAYREAYPYGKGGIGYDSNPNTP